MQPYFRKGAEISVVLSSLTEPVHGERVRLRSLYECHRSSQAWASHYLREPVVTIYVDPLPQEEDVGLWDKRLMTQKIPEQWEADVGAQISWPETWAPTYVFLLNSVLNYFTE